MRKYILKIVVFLYGRTQRVRNYIRYCHSVYSQNEIKKRLGNVGENTYIGNDCQLQGGGSRSIKIGHDTSLGSHVILGSWIKYNDKTYNPSLSIGNYTCIGDYTQISSAENIVIGNWVLTGKFVYISDNDHGKTDIENLREHPLERDLFVKGAVRIGDNVWIGDKVSILSGVSIGEGSVIAANAVVTKDIPPYCVAAGVPAKVIKSLLEK